MYEAVCMRENIKGLTGVARPNGPEVKAFCLAINKQKKLAKETAGPERLLTILSYFDTQNPEVLPDTERT